MTKYFANTEARHSETISCHGKLAGAARVHTTEGNGGRCARDRWQLSTNLRLTQRYPKSARTRNWVTLQLFYF